MLVLSRKRGERIWIGPDIELMVIDVRGDRVQLGFCAPRDVTIHRQEVQRRAKTKEATRTRRAWLHLAPPSEGEER
jgi:carbon storage regulator